LINFYKAPGALTGNYGQLREAPGALTGNYGQLRVVTGAFTGSFTEQFFMKFKGISGMCASHRVGRTTRK
jgi:hypothetical protein